MPQRISKRLRKRRGAIHARELAAVAKGRLKFEHARGGGLCFLQPPEFGKRSGQLHIGNAMRRVSLNGLVGSTAGFVIATAHQMAHCLGVDGMIPAGFATGRHVHRVQEGTFYLLEGECEWHIGEKTIRATAGTYLFIPPGVPHNITNVSEKPARVLMTVSPPGHEHYFEELAELVAQGSPDPKALAQLQDRYDTDQLSTLTTRI